MKKTINKIITLSILMFISILALGCSSSPKMRKAPAWVYYPSDVYPDDLYLTYVGRGMDRGSAEVSALNGLSAIFEQSIESNTKATSRMTQAKKEGIVATSRDDRINQEILKRVNIDNLTGVEIKDYFFNDVEGEWNAIAVLDKKAAIPLYKNMIEKNAEVIREITNGIGSDKYSLQAYCAYDFAQEIAKENKQHLQRLYVIDYKVAETLQNYAIPESNFIEKKRNIANNIPINIDIKSDDKGICKAAFLDAFKTYNFSGSEKDNARYVIKGEVSFGKVSTTDGKTTKCNYELQSTLYDTQTKTLLFPINIRGRQSHVTYEKARERAEIDLREKINSEFVTNFNNYLTNYSAD